MIYALGPLCFLAGLLLFWIVHKIRLGGFERLGQEILRRSEIEAEKKERAHTRKLEKRSQDLVEREREHAEKLDRQLTLVERKLSEIEKRENKLDQKESRLEALQKESRERKESLEEAYTHLSGLSKEEARTLYLEKTAAELKQESARLILRLKQEAQEEGEKVAKQILATAINRLALPTLSEIAVTTVALPNEEMKGRIIGREGRNIRTLEQLTGVNFMLDDTPNAIVISGFDPIRKEIAKRALTQLIQDGRIHPTRIETCVTACEEQIEKEIGEKGKEGARRAGVHGLHPELTTLLGQLAYRYSLGQNLLEHSIEVSRLMGMLAAELSLDEDLARRIGLLHDIGKAVTQDEGGSHALIGHELTLKWGESEEVANGVGCHHEEMAPLTIEGVLCSAADALSGGRPGARIEALEQYLKRSRKLEALTRQIEGVEKAYALQAGREVRVIVEPERFDDAATVHLAQTIAKRIEQELSFPGKIKVTVIREKRAIEYAS